MQFILAEIEKREQERQFYRLKKDINLKNAVHINKNSCVATEGQTTLGHSLSFIEKRGGKCPFHRYVMLLVLVRRSKL